MLTGVSLFAGIGGFDLAMQRAGIEVKAAVEIDAKCRQVLGRRFPESSLFGDIQEVTGADLRASGFAGASGVITGGFPCQDLSVAGRRAGLEGARSGLFWEIVRLLDETQSKWFVLENVPGLLNSQRGRDMGIVVGTLAELGYGVAWRVLDAQHFGVPQRRRRVFIVGCAGDPASGPEVLFEPERSAGNDRPGKQARQVHASVTGTRTEVSDRPVRDETWVKTIRSGARAEDGSLPAEVWAASATAPTLNAFDNNSESRATILAGTRRITPRECERLQGFPDDWTNGQSDSARYRQLGNAVAVPVVEWILRRLVEVDRERA